MKSAHRLRGSPPDGQHSVKRSKGLTWITGVPPGHGHAECGVLEEDVLVHQTGVSY